MERFRTWHEILMERLSDPEDVIGYLLPYCFCAIWYYFGARRQNEKP